MPEVTQTADVELGVEETTNLNNQKLQTESLQNQLNSLQGDIQQRITNCEQNRIHLTKQEAIIPELRDKYDACIDRGDASGSGKVLAEIRKSHKNLVNTARNVLSAGDDRGDLEARGNNLYTQINKLVMMAGGNWRLAKVLLDAASSLSGTITNSIWRDTRKLSQEIEAGKKVAQRIVAEN